VHNNPPAPQLQNDPEADLNYMREQENETLTRYGWVDQGRGVVRLPIDRAIQLAAQRAQQLFPSSQAPLESDEPLLNQAAASSPLQPGQAITVPALPQPNEIPDRTYQVQEQRKGNE
jgi:hypothetical protein